MTNESNDSARNCRSWPDSWFFPRENSGEFWVFREENNSIDKSMENQIILRDDRVSDKHANPRYFKLTHLAG